ncbi:MAG: TIGR03086 family metal-binding protein [Actinomycetota bacterium]|nr:TIGR03086 family metal-binding protein [Actinomycetota bacterium]
MSAAPSDLDALTLAGDHLSRLGSSIGDRAWDGPTPCAEWTVGDLVDHVVGGNVFTAEILGGATADDAMTATMATFGDEYDRASALAETTRRQHEAFTRSGALDGSYHHINGRLGGRDVLRARLHDLIIHGWDLAEALDPPAAIDDELVAWAVAELAASGSLTAEHFGIDASAITDDASLLAAFGRTPTR